MATKYRIISRTTGNTTQYRAQLKGLFFWKSFWTGEIHITYTDGASRIYSWWEDTIEEAEADIAEHRERTAPKPKIVTTVVKEL